MSMARPYYPSRDQLVEDVKTIGRTITEKADDIVGDWKGVHHYTITATIGTDFVPQLIVTKQAHALKIEVFNGENQ